MLCSACHVVITFIHLSSKITKPNLNNEDKDEILPLNQKISKPKTKQNYSKQNPLRIFSIPFFRFCEPKPLFQTICYMLGLKH